MSKGERLELFPRVSAASSLDLTAKSEPNKWNIKSPLVVKILLNASEGN